MNGNEIGKTFKKELSFIKVIITLKSLHYKA